MKRNQRFGFAAACIAACAAHAQTTGPAYPAKSVRLIVGYTLLTLHVAYKGSGQAQIDLGRGRFNI